MLRNHCVILLYIQLPTSLTSFVRFLDRLRYGRDNLATTAFVWWDLFGINVEVDCKLCNKMISITSSLYDHRRMFSLGVNSTLEQYKHIYRLPARLKSAPFRYITTKHVTIQIIIYKFISITKENMKISGKITLKSRITDNGTIP